MILGSELERGVKFTFSASVFVANALSLIKLEECIMSRTGVLFDQGIIISPLFVMSRQQMCSSGQPLIIIIVLLNSVWPMM